MFVTQTSNCLLWHRIDTESCDMKGQVTFVTQNWHETVSPVTYKSDMGEHMSGFILAFDSLWHDFWVHVSHHTPATCVSSDVDIWHVSASGSLIWGLVIVCYLLTVQVVWRLTGRPPTVSVQSLLWSLVTYLRRRATRLTFMKRRSSKWIQVSNYYATGILSEFFWIDFAICLVISHQIALLLGTNVTAIVIGSLAGCDSDMPLAQFPAMRSPDSMECTLTSESRDSSVVGEPARAGLSSRSSTIDDRSDSEQDYKLTYEVSRGDHTTVPHS